MGRTVLADTERIVTPYEFHGHLHEGRHADGRLHVVGEDEECAHCRDDAAMEHHANAHTCHGQFAYASLEESAAEVAAGEGMCVLEKAVGLVGIAEVGG